MKEGSGREGEGGVESGLKEEIPRRRQGSEELGLVTPTEIQNTT